MQKTLMTPSLVIQYSGVSLSFPVCDFNTLAMNEEYEMEECLGGDFYQDMLDDLVDYSNTEEYSPLESYIIGNTVFFDGVAYEAIAVVEGIEPPNKDYWQLGRRFGSDCYEDFFCRYLAYYLAHIILRLRLPFIRTRIEGRGTLQYEGQDYKTSDRKDYESLDAAILRQIQIAQANMLRFLKKNKTNTCYENYIGFGCSECGKQNCDCNKEHQGHEYLIA